MESETKPDDGSDASARNGWSQRSRITAMTANNRTPNSSVHAIGDEGYDSRRLKVSPLTFFSVGKPLLTCLAGW